MLTKQIDLNKTNLTLDDLLDQLTPNTEILIMRGDAPVARLASAETTPAAQRFLGLHTGEGHISDDFTDELPDSFWLDSDPS